MFVNEDTATTIISSVGQCAFVSERENIGWMILGPVVAFHVALLVGTNIILWNVRNVEDRYQEQKYVFLASTYVVEVLLVGVPVLFALRGSTSGVPHLILILIVFLVDFGILCLVFIPKIQYQKAGLPEGVPVHQTIMRASVGTSRASAGGRPVSQPITVGEVCDREDENDPTESDDTGVRNASE